MSDVAEVEEDSPESWEELSLAEQSFRNLVNFFSEELRQVDSGEKSSNYFNECQRRKLTDIGILIRTYGYGGCRLLVSEKAKSLLELEH